MSIDHINLSRFDLNLLVALDALLLERRVTRAAVRVGLRQSAMSHNLARLRRLLDDELLTRGPDGMRPTPRALALADPLRITLAQITNLVSRDETFDAGRAERRFRIALPDSAEVLFGPALLAHVCETAPGVRLRLYAIDRLFDELDADHLDLGIVYGALPEGRAHHKQRRLGTDSFLCMFNAARVGVSPPISLEDYLRLPHVLSSQGRGGQGIVDAALASIGLRRNVVLTTPHFVAVPFLVAGAAVVTTMHSKLARFFAGTLGLSLSPVPVELRDQPVTLVWHASYDRDPAHIWLRRAVMRVAAEVGWDGGSV
jgi:LysR family transcriptional regulator, mexEF-oprN operon transcriptional activator